ncbi:gamma-interferon-responsive lysosomal thiol protein-like isoform X1 [Tasmannia lanceolata]|uniref:gamma-interferon-responsive lysosomal thiol protein-like isoform X1 n=1 Tax=Tasmannia lanceolata TaxID=3420 RepID=UPI004064B336
MASRSLILLALFLSVFFLFDFGSVSASRVGFSDSDSAPKVSLGLYYETLCPYCSNFIVNFLAKIFKNGLLEIVDLNLVPYGNARIGSNETIACQHGPYECLLNTVEACAIKVWPEVHQHFAFIYCVETLVIERKYNDWESCFQKTGLGSQLLVDCFNSGNGKKLELQYANETGHLNPPHTYVPWVVVDGQPLNEDYENFKTYVCKAYKGTPPEACKALPLGIIPEKKADLLDRVCYSEEILHSSVISMRRQMEIPAMRK